MRRDVVTSPVPHTKDEVIAGTVAPSPERTSSEGSTQQRSVAIEAPRGAHAAPAPRAALAPLPGQIHLRSHAGRQPPSAGPVEGLRPQDLHGGPAREEQQGEGESPRTRRPGPPAGGGDGGAACGEA